MDWSIRQYFICRILFNLLLPVLPLTSIAQYQSQPPTRLLRVYEDNDFINIAGYSTDKAYTNGTKIDFFYTNQSKQRWGLSKLLPTAGANSTNILSWGIAELMFTPNDLSRSTYQSNDYPYSTALYITHGLHSYNAEKKLSLHTELLAGIRGPAALGEQTQTLIHRALSFPLPMGWNNQLKNKILLNANFAAEKELYADKNLLDIIGAALVEAGTFSNSVTFSPVIRLGKMNPYFNGIISQYTTGAKYPHSKKKNVQLYLLFKPGFTWYASNAMLQAGNQQFIVEGKTEKLSALKHAVWFFNGGAVLSVNRMGISFNQNLTTALMQNLYAHAVGNVSLYYGL